LRWAWRFWARPGQLPPGTLGAESQRSNWIHWVPLAGRGWGKTRVGAETVRIWGEVPTEKIHLVGPTTAAVRSVMIDGPSGLMSCYPPYRRPDYEPSKHRVIFPSGAIAETFSADEPERLRGPQCSKYWADEPCAWRFLQEAWDNLMFGFRLGSDPRGVCTTTPKPFKWLRDIIADPNTVTTRHSTKENRANLAKAFFESIIRKYEGTRLGRQEIEAEILEDIPGALWTRQLIEAGRVKEYPQPLSRVVVAVDPAVSSGEESSETGIVIVGLSFAGHVYVLADLTLRGTPLEWARVAVAAMRNFRADLIVGEVNNGGDLVEANVRTINPNVPFRKVRASRGKLVRAEPVANLYEQGRVHHFGALEQLEDQMCSYVPAGDMASPDRMDAMVWGITELLIDTDQTPTYNTLVSRVTISNF